MNGTERRKKILQLIAAAAKPISGTALGKATGVTRQVIVQDIALLRTEGHPILSAARGYLLQQPAVARRLLKLCHTNEQMEDELTTIVDLGGCVQDVIVNHRAYGEISAPLNIHSRRDIKHFLQDIRSGKSSPLLNVTSGYHFHHITAESEALLDEIETALQNKGYVQPLLPYEIEALN